MTNLPSAACAPIFHVRDTVVVAQAAKELGLPAGEDWPGWLKEKEKARFLAHTALLPLPCGPSASACVACVVVEAYSRQITPLMSGCHKKRSSPHFSKQEEVSPYPSPSDADSLEARFMRIDCVYFEDHSRCAQSCSHMYHGLIFFQAFLFT